MFAQLKKILQKIDADYADIRYEKKKETAVSFNGKELAQVTSNGTDGYVIRVLYKGGFSSIAFTRPEDAEKAVLSVTENARLLSANIKEPVKLASVKPVKDHYRPSMAANPENISIEEKISLVRNYNAIPLRNEKVVSTRIGYSETARDKFFLSTEGAEIHEELMTVSITGLITAKDGTNIQNMRVGMGGSNGFGTLKNRETIFEKQTKTVTDLLAAEPVSAGTYNVILDPELGGVFTHEAFGHFSEADIIEEMPELRAKMHLGAKLGSDILNITDDPTIPGQLGFYKYDDEGVPAQKSELMKNGVLTGRLHSRKTAAAFGEPANGHCVAEDYHFAPIIRMGTIFIEPNPDMSFEKMIGSLGDGLYLCGMKGGQTMGENFTFGAGYGFEVKGGKKGKMIREINILGNLFTTLKNISAVGNEMDLDETGGCGKGQLNIRSCHGGPHLLMKDVVIGGK